MLPASSVEETAVNGVALKPSSSHLTSFAGHETGNKYTINWQVQNEDTSAVYIIEKSRSILGPFTEVNRLVATTGVAKVHSLKLPLSSGFSYYRLKIVPFGGKVEYSEIIKSNSINQQSLRAFITGANLLLKLPPSTTSIEIVDASGNTVKKQETEISAIQTNVSLTNIARGVLTIRALTENEWQTCQVLF